MYSKIVKKWKHKVKYAIFVYDVRDPDNGNLIVETGCYDHNDGKIVPIFVDNNYNDPTSVIGAGQLRIEDGIGYLYVSKELHKKLDDYFVAGTIRGMGSFVNKVRYETRGQDTFVVEGTIQAAYMSEGNIHEGLIQRRRWDRA